MAKEKVVYKNRNNVTLKKLKYTIIVCFIACIIFEFAPDILEIYKRFEYYSFLVFLQHHKDFFTNVALGCLGSAVISYLILRIQTKIIEKEKKENLNIILKKVVLRYWYLIYAITNSYKIKNEDNELKIIIEEFISYYEEAGVSNKSLEDFIEIFNSKLIPMVNEVEMFLDSFNLLVNKEEIIKMYSKEVYNEVVKEIYGSFYKSLSKEFQLHEVNKKLVCIKVANDSLIEELEKMLELIHTSSSIEKHVSHSIKYSQMMQELLVSENLDKIEKGITVIY